MRRLVSGLCLSLMFLAVSFAQTAWWLSSTVFDTTTFRDAVHTIAAEPVVRDALGDDVTGALAGGHDMSAKQSRELRDAVDASVGGPQFAEELADTLARVHAALLAGRSPATALDLAVVQDDVRRSLAADDPRLAAAVPDARLQRRVDPGRLPWLPRVVDAVGTAVPVLVAASLVLLALAVLVARDRPRTLRRAGYVLLASTVFTLVTRFVIPVLLLPVLPAGAVRTLGGAIVSFLFGALVPALVVTALVAVTLVSAGFAWSRARAHPRARVQGPAPAPAPAPRVHPVTGPPVANAAVVSPAPPMAAVVAAVRRGPVPTTAPQPPATLAMADTAVADTAVADSDEDPGGWGPLRY